MIARPETIEKAIAALRETPYPGKLFSMGSGPGGETNRATWEAQRAAMVTKLMSLLQGNQNDGNQ